MSKETDEIQKKTKEKRREIRLFISSTFRDMQEEREHITKVVSPELVVLCRKRGVTLTLIDLRWGITSDESILGQALELCLREIDKARPHFIGIIAHKYGSIAESGACEGQEIKKKIDSWIKEGLSYTAIEIEHGVLSNPQLNKYSYFYFRSRKLTEGLSKNKDKNDFIETDPGLISKLDGLKARIMTDNSPWHWDNTEYGTIEELGESIKRDFTAMLDEVYPESEAPTEVERERFNHQAYADFMLNNIYEPEEIFIKEIKDISRLALTGPQGIGKSALVSYLVKQYREENKNAFIFEHFVGVGSFNAYGVIQRLYNEINEKLKSLGKPEKNIPEKKDDKFFESIPDFIFSLPDYKSSLIAIDALDQLNEEDQGLSWLLHLPQSIGAIVSLKTDTTAYGNMQRLKDIYAIKEIKPLSDDSCEKILKDYLSKKGKELTDLQVKKVLSSESSRNPLYLRLLLDELSVFGGLKPKDIDQDKFMDGVIDAYLKSKTLIDLYLKMIDRVKTHHPCFNKVLPILTFSRSGLTQSEILGISKISAIDFLLLRYAFDYHLSEKDGLFYFYHTAFYDACKNLFAPEGIKARKSIADYFWNEKVDHRQVYELPYQLKMVGDKKRLKKYLGRAGVFEEYVKNGDSFEYGFFGLELSSYFRFTGSNCSEIASLCRASVSKIDAEKISYLFHIGYFLYYLGCYKEAESLFKEVIEIDKTLNPESLKTAEYMNYLSDVYFAQGRFNESESLLKSALEIAEKIPDADGQDGVAAISNGLARNYAALGLSKEAESFYRKSLEIRKATLGENHFKFKSSLIGLASFYKDQHRYEEAESILKPFLEVNNKSSGVNIGDNNTLDSLVEASLNSALADIYRFQGRHDEAEPLCKRALDIIEKYGSNNPLISFYLSDLALNYTNQHRYDEAELLFKRALDIAEKTLGPEYPGIKLVLDNFGLLYKNWGKYDKAESLYKRALDIAEKTFGTDDPRTADYLNNLALLYDNWGFYDKAEPIYERLLEIRKKSPITAEIHNNLYLNYLGDQNTSVDKKELFLKRALKIRRKVLGSDDPDNLIFLNNLGRLYMDDMGKYDRAEPLFKKGLAICEKKDSEDFWMDYFLEDLAILYSRWRKYNEALIYYKKLLNIRKNRYGLDDPRTIEINELTDVLNKKIKTEERGRGRKRFKKF